MRLNEAATQRRDVFADANGLLLDSLKAFLPAEAVSVSEYVARNRWMANHGGGYVGMWSHAEAPYLTGMMDSQSDTSYPTSVFIGPGQSAKTTAAENWLMYSVGVDPANMLWYSATEMLIRGFVRSKINPMIEVNRSLSEHLGRGLADNSLGFKRFGPMSVEFLPATASTMISKSAPRIVVDEYDAVCVGMGSAEGPADVEQLVSLRRQAFGERSKLVLIGHADLAGGLEPEQWLHGIAKHYRGSTQRKWYWQCPECGVFSSPHPGAERVMTLDYDEDAPLDEVQDMARLLCPTNGCLIEDRQRRGMNLTGKWVGRGEAIDETGIITGELKRAQADGWWIVGAMSNFVLGGIGSLARRKVEAERAYAASGDVKPLREVMAKHLGYPLERKRRAHEIDASTLAARAEPELERGIVANGVRFITVHADVQSNRFEAMVRGWGIAGESWVIDYRTFAADTTVSAGDWDRLIAWMTETVWPLDDASGRGMKARCAGIDMAGAPGSTLQAYDAWRRARKSRLARNLGRIDGRDCWTLILTKGASSPNAPRLQVVYPDTERRDRMAAARGEIPLALFNGTGFKDGLSAQLAKADAGPWAMHVPAALRKSETEPGPFFEGLVAEVRKSSGRWKKLTENARNEPLDTAVGNHVLAHLNGLDRIAWDRPPPWAAEWDNNSNVLPLRAVSGTEAEDKTGVATAYEPLPEIKPALSAPVVRAPGLAGVKLITRVPFRR